MWTTIWPRTQLQIGRARHKVGRSVEPGSGPAKHTFGRTKRKSDDLDLGSVGVNLRLGRYRPTSKPGRTHPNEVETNRNLADLGTNADPTKPQRASAASQHANSQIDNPCRRNGSDDSGGAGVARPSAECERPPGNLAGAASQSSLFGRGSGGPTLCDATKPNVKLPIKFGCTNLLRYINDPVLCEFVSSPACHASKCHSPGPARLYGGPSAQRVGRKRVMHQATIGFLSLAHAARSRARS